MIRAFLRSFSAGELTPELLGRLDFAKYQEGLATCRNFVTLPHGPAVNRTGTQFVREVKASASATRIIPFSYNSQQVFAIEMGAGYFRFHTDAQTLFYTTPAAWSNATAYSVGDMVSLSGVNYYCITGNTNNTPPNASYWYVLPQNPNVYEIPNPYAAADLMDIHFVQSADVLTLTHQNYRPMELRRAGATNWQLSAINFIPKLQPPIYSAYTPSAINHTYVVTSLLILRPTPLNTFNYETTPSAEVTVSADLNAPGAKNTITWGETIPANFPDLKITSPNGFCVYKKVGSQYQYLGIASGHSFVDDIFLTPNPSRLAPATGYATTASSLAAATASGSATISAVASGGGTGVTYSYVVTSVNGLEESIPTAPATCTNNLSTAGTYNTIAWCPVAGVSRYNVYKLSNGIYGYIGQAGAGTTFVDNNIIPDISRTPLIVEDVFSTSGNYPATVTYYEQRRCFAAPTNAPQNVWMTRSGTESNMGYTIPTRDDNRLAFKIAAREASAIRHLVPMTNLIALSASGEWNISSASGALTPSTITVKQQSYYGASNVMPVVVGSMALYAAARGGHLRELSYSWQAQSYLSNDISLLALHLFDYNTILDMALSKGPIPILWVVSSTGQLLGMTYVPDQQIAAWHRHDTGGGDKFESICTITENGEDMLYAVVNRTIGGATKRYIERMHTRNFATLADAYFVDSGATYYMSGTFSRAGTAMTCTIAGHGFTNGQSYAFYFSDASFGALPNGTSYVVTVVDANTFTLTVANAGATTGTVTQLVTTVSGLTWLEGRTVNILADGAVSPQATVTGGAITLPQAAAKVTIGIPIQADLQTLPVISQQDSAFSQGRPKNLNRVFLRVNRSSGVLVGHDFVDLVPYKQRTSEPYGSPPSLVSDEISIVPSNAWGSSGQVCVRQNDPLPLDIVSMTLEVAMGGG